MQDWPPEYPVRNHLKPYWGDENNFTKWLATEEQRGEIGTKEQYLLELEQMLGIHLFKLEDIRPEEDSDGEGDRYNEYSVADGDFYLDNVAIASIDRNPGSGFRPAILETQFGTKTSDSHNHLGKLTTYPTTFSEVDISDFTSLNLGPPLVIWIVQAEPNPYHVKNIKRLDDESTFSFILLKGYVDEQGKDAPTVGFEVLHPESSLGELAPSDTKPASIRKTWKLQKFWTELSYRLREAGATDEHLQLPQNVPKEPKYRLGNPTNEQGVRLRFHLITRREVARCYAEFESESAYRTVQENLQGLKTSIGQQTNNERSGNIEPQPPDHEANNSKNPRIVVQREYKEFSLLSQRDRERVQRWFIDYGEAFAAKLDKELATETT